MNWLWKILEREVFADKTCLFLERIIDFFAISHSQASVVFLITIHSYANEKSEMEELSMVALSGCIWLQAFVVTLETK